MPPPCSWCSPPSSTACLSAILCRVSSPPRDRLSPRPRVQLVITGAFRTVDQKPTRKKLEALKKQILAAAEKGTKDDAGLKEFLKVAKIERNYEEDALGIFNPKQRRNAGAPTTDAILDQMATYKYALYEPTKTGKGYSTSK